MTLLTVSTDISPATVENKPATELVVGGAPDPSIIAYAHSSVRVWCGVSRLSTQLCYAHSSSLASLRLLSPVVQFNRFKEAAVSLKSRAGLES